MKKRFAPLAILFGLLTAMLLGSTSVAQATALPLPTLNACTQGVVVVNVVTCNDILNNNVVKITTNNVLTDAELVTLKNNLNNATIVVDILNDASVYAAKLVVVTVYNNIVDPDITVGNVTICVALVCK